MSTTMVSAPEVRPSLGFDDPVLEAVTWVTNSSCDDLRPEGDGKPLTDDELKILPSEGGIPTDYPSAALTCGASGVLDGERVYIFTVEFHYRNDASRHMWGTPVTVEDHIAVLMEQQTIAVKRAFAAALPRLVRDGVNGTAVMRFREYMQDSGESTDDRHVLYLFVPIKAIKSITGSPVDTPDKLVRWIKHLIT